ncbi:MAG: phospholipase D-like domain-containing protein, partial [Sphingosinicella sp.]
ARIRLRPEDEMTLGQFILHLVRRRPELEIYLLRWNFGAVKTLFRGTTVLTLIRWMRHKRIHTKLDSAHPPGAAHHQKIVVIDDCLAFCGGIDMTADRWDTREHRDGDAHRIEPNGKPYGPWHDATMAVEGAAAAALGDQARERWKHATGRSLAAVNANTACWPSGLPAHFRNVEVSIALTRPKMSGVGEVRSVEQLYLEQIAAARKSIYAENQYFASQRIAEAMMSRLAEAGGPEIVLICPESSEGWLEQAVMDSARARLHQRLSRADKYGRLRLYHPYTASGRPIYVHAKILIVDDRWLRIGSSNFNNRSLGLDTECDLAIDAGRARNSKTRATIRQVRDDLLAEHLGVAAGEVAKRIDAEGSLIAAIEALRGRGRSLRRYRRPEIGETRQWLADSKVLDPEDSEEMFEPLTRRGRFRRLLRR